MNVPDEVRKELTIAAPRERVWRALTTVEGLIGWFPDRSAEIDLRPGGALRLEWKTGESDAGVIDEVVPPSRLVFRWWQVAGELRTRVEITLDEVEGGTHLTLVESGFRRWPKAEREEAWKGNDDGWTKELDELRAYVEVA